MGCQDENSATTQVAVFETRRLFRQAFSIWLSGQDGIELVGSTSALGTIMDLHSHGRLDSVVIGMDPDRDKMLQNIAAIASLSGVRVIATSDSSDETDATELLKQGCRAVVPLSAGAPHLLRAIHAGAAVRIIGRPTNLQASPYGPLTPRETEVLALVCKGRTTYDIANHLGISRSTIANHKERIFTKLQAKNQAHAVARAVSLGIISPERDERTLKTG